MNTFLLLRETPTSRNAETKVSESVREYLTSEMPEMFNPEELAALASGKPVTKTNPFAVLTYVDMAVAARKLLAEAAKPKTFRVYTSFQGAQEFEDVEADSANAAIEAVKAKLPAKVRQWSTVYTNATE